MKYFLLVCVIAGFSCNRGIGKIDSRQFEYIPREIIFGQSSNISPKKGDSEYIYRQTIFFNFNSEFYSKDYNKSLNDIIFKMKENKSYVLVIEGYADESGSFAYNLSLTQKRAESVLQKILILAPELKSRKITSLGKGEDKSKKSSSKKRRVELKIFNE